MYLPTLKQLKYLVELERHGHFGRAAEACSVTQSTLSAGLQELENLLDCKLVERTKRRVFFTELGTEITKRATGLLREAEEIASLARHGNRLLSGDLKLGAIPTIAPYLLPQTLPLLREEYPDLRLFLIEDETARLVKRLREGSLDAALMAFPYDEVGLEWIELAEDPFLLAHPTNHPVTNMTSADIHQFLETQSQQKELILLEEGHCLRDHALAACQTYNLKTDQTLQASSLLTLVHMVANGLGITLLPSLACQTSLLEGTNISLSPLEGQETHRKLGLAWRKSSVRKEELKQLAKHLSHTAREQIAKFQNHQKLTKIQH
ncbi:hydrogen peroxide-inducible genes activator [Kiloniella antarctica]|uniref:LysR substrate-binding domain-containing protein n=1 Tax=Kiloniella antarctica TaxID=1550907 RepID=A0ABW5BPC2_9PROT